MLGVKCRWMGCLLAAGIAQICWLATPASGQTTIERSRDIEVNTDASQPEFEGSSIGEDTANAEGAASTDDSASGQTIEFSQQDSTPSTPPPAAPPQAQARSEGALERYHIRQNICTGDWSWSEINSLFPNVSVEMVREVCR
ncbi:MAG: hypothetical protein AB4040_08795 [Synechococcus sp.]